MFKLYAGFILFFCCAAIRAQSPAPLKEIKWAWVSGENKENSMGNYGIQEVKSKSNMPVARSFSNGWTDKEGNFWMFGGTHNKENFFNDVWEYIPSEDVWVWTSGDNITDQKAVYARKGFSQDNKPGARRGALSWTDGSGKFWMFGGYGIDIEGRRGWLNDLWQYVPHKGWQWMGGSDHIGAYGKYGTLQQGSPNNYPGGREGAIGWTDQSGNLWLFGGEGYAGDGSGLLNDVWQFSIRTNEWLWAGGAKIPNMPGNYIQKNIGLKEGGPGARKYSTAWIDLAGKLSMFGGWGYVKDGLQGYLNDMWTFDTKYYQWTWTGGEAAVDVPGKYYVMGYPTDYTYPGGRSGSVNWFDSKGYLWLFGGYGTDKNGIQFLLNDLWRFDHNKNNWTWVSGIDEINAEGTYGTKGVADVNNTPGARGLAVSWIDKAEVKWLFGGAGYATKVGGYLNDLWSIEPISRPLLSCPSSIVTNNDSVHCDIVVKKIDPIIAKGIKVRFDLSGATTATDYGTASGSVFNAGTTTVLYSIVDNPRQSCRFTVRVEDHSAPVPFVKTLPDIVGECSVKVNDIPVAHDNCSGKIKGTTRDAIVYKEPGDYIVNWTYADGNGNTSEQVQKIMVKPETGQLKPVIVNLPDIIGECSATVTAIPQAAKNCGGFINGKTDAPLTYKKQGEYTIIWLYDNGKGDTARQTQKVIVKDITDPVKVIKSLPDIKAECSVKIDKVPVAIDNCAGEIKGTTINELTYSEEGEHIITWIYNDGNGNIEKQQQRVIIASGLNKVSPVIPNLPDVISECAVTITDIPKAVKSCGGYISAKTNEPLTYTKQGAYAITWVYNSGNGNSIRQLQKVIVKDITAPVPALEKLPDVVGECYATVNVVPTGMDNCAGLVKAKTKSALRYNRPGEYFVTWIYADGNGNSAMQTQRVVIQSRQGSLVPFVTNLPDIVGECTVTVPSKPEARDKCLGTIVATTNDPLVYTEPGTYIVHWKFATGSDTIMKLQTVIVKSLGVDVTLFPNPTHNYFTIAFRSCKKEEPIGYSVFDVMGRRIETSKVNANVPVKFGGQYPGGAYFIRITQQNEILVKKLLKLK